jgi:hypothetical protein
MSFNVLIDFLSIRLHEFSVGNNIDKMPDFHLMLVPVVFSDYTGSKYLEICQLLMNLISKECNV